MHRLLAVVAHPDDESFGLGALLDRFASCGVTVTVLCFTVGEASTLHAGVDGFAVDHPDADPARLLATVREAELRAAAGVLGIDHVELLGYPDGHLAQTPADELATHVGRLIESTGTTHILAFDSNGVTGHPDHIRATEAAVAAASVARLPVLAWTIPDLVAARLNARHGTAFGGRTDDEIDLRLSVSRDRQRRAIAAHRSQATGNAVLEHRLRLLGDTEYLRMAFAPTNPPATEPATEPAGSVTA